MCGTYGEGLRRDSEARIHGQRHIADLQRRDAYGKENQQMAQGQDGKINNSDSQLVGAETVEMTGAHTEKTMPKGPAWLGDIAIWISKPSPPGRN